VSDSAKLFRDDEVIDYRSLLRIDDSVWQRLESHAFDDLTEAERTFAVVRSLQGQVCNGGFDQYFFNTSGDRAGVADAAFRAINAPELAEIVAAAIAVFGPKGPPIDRGQRWAAMERLGKTAQHHWSALDSRFYALDNIDELLVSYVAAERAQFRR
jgi:hypothetical protein